MQRLSAAALIVLSLLLAATDSTAAADTPTSTPTPNRSALRAAQAETRALYPHPYYWAAFSVTGDPGRGSATLAQAVVLGAALLAACLAAGGCTLLVRRRRSQCAAIAHRPKAC